MADDLDDIEDDEDEDGEEKPKKSIVKLAMLIGIPVVVLILGAAAFFMFFSGGDDEEVALVCDEHGEHCEAVAGNTQAEAPPEHVYYYSLQPEGVDSSIIVNIRSADGRPLNLKLSLAFESTDPQLGSILQEHLQPVMDQFIPFLSELREDDLYGSAGPHRVRLELLRRVNLVIEPHRVDQVRITELIIAD